MKIGTRVRKVRGRRNLGLTGVVVGYGDRGHTLIIAADAPWLNMFNEWRPARVLGYWIPDQWEPIVPEGHQPAEETAEELLPFLKGVSA